MRLSHWLKALRCRSLSRASRFRRRTSDTRLAAIERLEGRIMLSSAKLDTRLTHETTAVDGRSCHFLKRSRVRPVENVRKCATDERTSNLPFSLEA
jgi:hypothetical protein